ncbi:hypothetical protein JKP88DRAFT_255390 [Tribonema minus]|uniref:Secreted protein n=1 Tax=Tribonema minus TaxID=303371 RepID=A0A835Z054_9STRA|nr:hypothetical protein JKP88DRAFT_255390 [Tribonema minus]
MALDTVYVILIFLFTIVFARKSRRSVGSCIGAERNSIEDPKWQDSRTRGTGKLAAKMWYCIPRQRLNHCLKTPVGQIFIVLSAVTAAAAKRHLAFCMSILQCVVQLHRALMHVY